MWGDAQSDGRPAEYRWCRLLNAVEQIAKMLLDLVQFGGRKKRCAVLSN